MTTAQEAEDNERLFVEKLRSRYEEVGYDFQPYPDPDHLPEFMGNYRPDAIASKGNEKIAIEVKSQRSPSADLTIRRIRQIFEGHKDWQLRVIFITDDPQEAVSIPSSTPEIIQRRLTEVRELLKLGYARAAILLAWSLLEAVARIVEPSSGKRPYSPGTIVQTLAMSGHIAPELERQLRQLINLRNRLVHGDLEAEPSIDEVEMLLSAVEDALDQSNIQSP